MFDDYQGENDQVQGSPPAEAAPSGQSMWHGRIARDAQGRRLMWQEPQNGRGGRFVELNSSTATREAREAVEAARSRATVLDRLVPLAEEYIQLGRNTPTGGWRQRSFAREQQAEPGNLWNGLNFPVSWWDQDERGRVERLRGLEDEAVRANIQPGQAGTANSVFEQEVLRGMFPSIQTLGPTNQERAVSLFVRRDLERAQLSAMEQWLTQHPDLTGFIDAWSRREPQLRADRDAYYRERFGFPGARTGAMVGRVDADRNQPGQAPQAEEWVRNPQTGRLERRR